ncbi:ribonuclease P protein component [Candidatus Mycalebacterium sp.]
MSKIRGQALRKREKLMEKTEYVRVLKKGKRLSSQNFSVVIAENGLGFARVGRVVTKKTVPGAVSRNKIKRYFREIFRVNKSQFGSSDVIFRAENDVSEIPFGAVRAEIMGMISGEK